MRHHLDDARRDAVNTIKQANDALSSGKYKNPKNVKFIKDTRATAVRELSDLDRMDIDDRYDTRNDYTRYDMLNDAIDAVNRILPNLDNYYDVENRRGVKGTGRYGTGGRDRRKTSPIRGGRGLRRARMDMDDYDYDYDYDDDYYDYDDDYNVENRGPRYRSRRSGRFLPNPYPSRYKTSAMNDTDYTDDTSTVARAVADATANAISRHISHNENDRTNYTPVMPLNRNDNDNRTDTGNIGPRIR